MHTHTFVSLIKTFCAVIILTACSSFTKLNNNKVPIKHRTNNICTDVICKNITNFTKEDPSYLQDYQVQDKKIRKIQSIYFDYDNYNIKDKFYSIIEEHAQYLILHKKHNVIIQGHTDDRGSTEYNLALGQKRAEVVRKALILLGVLESQIEAVSFGEEKPRALNHDEASRAENRRADFYYR